MGIRILEQERARVTGTLDAIQREKATAQQSVQAALARLAEQEDEAEAQLAEIEAAMAAAAVDAEKTAQLAALQATHSQCTTVQTQLTSERDQARSQRDNHAGTITTLQADKAHLNTLLDASLATINGKDQVIAARDATIAQHLATIGLRDAEIASLKAQLGPQFKVYNEWKSKPDMSAEKMPPIRVIYEGEITQPGKTATDAPDPVWLADKYAEIKAQDTSVTRVCIDQEALLLGGAAFPTASVPHYVTYLEKAKEVFSDVGLYMFPERSYGFTTGSDAPGSGPNTGTQNGDRKLALTQRTQALSAITDLCDTFYWSCYYLNPIHINATRRDQFIQFYYDLCNLIGPGKKQIPFVYPIIHGGVPQVDLRGTWISGTYFKATLDKIYDVGCSGVAIFGQGSDPDPIATNMDWLINGVRPFISARGITL